MRIERYFSLDRNVVKHFPHHECKNLNSSYDTDSPTSHGLVLAVISGAAVVVYGSAVDILFLLFECRG